MQLVLWQEMGQITLVYNKYNYWVIVKREYNNWIPFVIMKAMVLLSLSLSCFSWIQIKLIEVNGNKSVPIWLLYLKTTNPPKVMLKSQKMT